MPIRPLFLGILLTCAASSAAGQVGPAPHPLPPLPLELQAYGSWTTSSISLQSSPITLPVAERQRPSPWRAVLIGTGAGAAVGAVAFLLQSDGCWRRVESMCELAIPIYVGVGAAAGGLIGYLVGGEAW